MPELHQTVMGQRLIEHTIPEIARQLERIADALEKKEVKGDQVSNAYRAFIKEFSNDADLGAAIRKLWKIDM